MSSFGKGDGLAPEYSSPEYTAFPDTHSGPPGYIDDSVQLLETAGNDPVTKHGSLQTEGDTAVRSGCSPAKVRRALKTCLLVLLACLLFSLGLAMVIHYFITSIGGTVLLGNSDVVSVSAINSSVNQIKITARPSLNRGERVGVNVYHDLCSEIERVQSVENSSTELTVSEDGVYEIGELYLTETSQVDYNFRVTESQFSGQCLANVYLFLEHSNYRMFLSTGIATNPSESYCLSPLESLVFHLKSDKDSYHFIGMKSSNSARLQYTVSKDLLKYNVTRATNVSCTLVGYVENNNNYNGRVTTTTCSVSLTQYPQEQEVCVLASLRNTNTFITLSHTFFFFDDVLLGFGFVFILFSPLAFFVYFVIMFSVCYFLTSKGSCRRCRRFYFWECLDECPCCDCIVASCNPFDDCCRQSCTSCHKCCCSKNCEFCVTKLI